MTVIGYVPAAASAATFNVSLERELPLAVAASAAGANFALTPAGRFDTVSAAAFSNRSMLSSTTKVATELSRLLETMRGSTPMRKSPAVFPAGGVFVCADATFVVASASPANTQTH
ncbi:hypothetical protein [Lysobacter firmicutimachus]|uniref:Uncharacterized protein n=1 Tax=Lysobacter firmicutimachus TaxID=1792846 RepID=A0ABU8D1D9_9GAMM